MLSKLLHSHAIALGTLIHKGNFERNRPFSKKTKRLNYLRSQLGTSQIQCVCIGQAGSFIRENLIERENINVCGQRGDYYHNFRTTKQMLF